MKNFTFYNPTRIVFGQGTISQVGPMAKSYGKKVLLHYGGGSIKRNGIYEQVFQSLKQSGMTVIELGGVEPNPRLSLVREGIKLCRNESVDVIIAVGGGSVIDSAKAIGFGVKLSDDEDIWDDYYMNASCTVRETLPVGVVLTIPAAGSESSISSVLTDWKSHMKRAVNCEALMPKFAIMDPETNYSLPAYQSACGAADILAHLMERYFTQERYNDLSDRFLEQAMRNVITYAPLVLKHPKDYRYRAELMWTGTLAHNGLLDRGRVGDWASHAIEHELSGLFDIAHGAGLTIVFPAWMKYVYHEHIDRFVQFACRVWDVSLTLDNKETIIEVAIDRMEAFFRSLGLPVRLSDAGIGNERIAQMVETAMIGRESIGTLKRLEGSDIEKILKLAL